jgi:hypothetical protein
MPRASYDCCDSEDREVCDDCGGCCCESDGCHECGDCHNANSGYTGCDGCAKRCLECYARECCRTLTETDDGDWICEVCATECSACHRETYCCVFSSDGGSFCDDCASHDPVLASPFAASLSSRAEIAQLEAERARVAAQLAQIDADVAAARCRASAAGPVAAAPAAAAAVAVDADDLDPIPPEDLEIRPSSDGTGPIMVSPDGRAWVYNVETEMPGAYLGYVDLAPAI